MHPRRGHGRRRRPAWASRSRAASWRRMEGVFGRRTLPVAVRGSASRWWLPASRPVLRPGNVPGSARGPCARTSCSSAGRDRCIPVSAAPSRCRRSRLEPRESGCRQRRRFSRPRSRITIDHGGELMITALTGRLAAAASLVSLWCHRRLARPTRPASCGKRLRRWRWRACRRRCRCRHRRFVRRRIGRATPGGKVLLLGLQDGRQQGDLEDAVQRANADAGTGELTFQGADAYTGATGHVPGHEHDDQASRQEGRHLR